MLKYEDYLQKCWLLNESEAHQDFIRSEFDYGGRQRRALRGYPKAGFRLTLDAYQMVKWKKFWDDLNQGTEKFETNQLIFGVFATPKTVRFIQAYRLREIGYMRWEVSCAVEILKIKDDYASIACPLMPHVGLVPHIPRVPCA